MNTYTIIDAQGEVYAILQANSPTTVVRNTPAGMTALPGAPPAPDAYWLTGTWYARPLQPSPDHSWDPVTKSWVDLRTLAEARAQKRQELAGAWSAERAAGVLVGGKTAPTDSEAWTRYLVIQAMASEGNWVDMPIPLTDGSFELLTAAKASALWSALKTMERTLLAKLQAKVALVNAAATIEEVDAISWGTP